MGVCGAIVSLSLPPYYLNSSLILLEIARSTDSEMCGNKKRVSMFSCHVHPDGSRIATGGVDA